MEPITPFPFDPAAAVRFVDACWFSHDGQWFLKVKDRFGLEAAMELNEAAVHAMGKIEARRVRDLTGIGEINDCVGFARFFETFRALRGVSPGEGWRIVSTDPDHLELAAPGCFLAEMAIAARMEGMGVGNFPGCRGFRSRIRGWGLVLSSQFDFIDEERPGEPGSGIVCHHRISRVQRGS
ncbi:MAG: hypothetical protein HYV92_13785 [Candidatus Rokubacteria bacterium]|nr:hypothetical protein [Candidatus Rokubacteria bacterium]